MKSPSTKVLPFVLSAAAAAIFLPFTARADVSLPTIFSEHMVLQRDQAVPVWGWAEAGEEVTVTLGKQTKQTKTSADGKWSVKLDKLPAGEPDKLVVKGKNTIEVEDVLVGEVWLCSGQSNMAFTVNRANNFEEEKAAANFPNIRMYTVISSGATEPQEKCQGKWLVCTPENVAVFSAAGYFFGRELHSKLKVPVGLVHSSVGGTPIEAWTSWDAQKDAKDLKFIFDSWDQRQATWDPVKAKEQYTKQKAAYDAASAKAKETGKPIGRAPQLAAEPAKDSHHPAVLFNGKINPIIPYAIRGAIWYQGESNADTVERGAAYRTQLPMMVADWRKRWGYEFPFAWVQLPDFNARNTEGWALVREAMLKSLKVPHTGMAIALGLGEAGDIHPKNKQEVGKRLASWALASVYAPSSGKKGAKATATSAGMGPLYASQKISGKDVTITFTQADGLTAKDGGVKGFTIAGADKEWKPATAKIVKGSVVVSSPEVAKPTAVRYAWPSNPEWSLVNAAGIPASPFRTDDWPIADPAPAAPAAKPAPAPAKQ